MSEVVGNSGRTLVDDGDGSESEGEVRFFDQAVFFVALSGLDGLGRSKLILGGCLVECG